MRFTKYFALLTACLMTCTAYSQKGPERFFPILEHYDAMDNENPPPEGVVLFTGSSSIRMYASLQAHFPDHEVLNRGFGGSEFSDLLYYWDKVILRYNPSAIFIYEGDNDIESGKDAEELVMEAETLRQLIAQNLPGVPVTFIAPKPSPARWHLKSQYEALNKGLKRLADGTENTEYADVWTPMLDENGVVRKDIWKRDSLHMNEAGYEIWREVLLRYMPQAESEGEE